MNNRNESNPVIEPVPSLHIPLPARLLRRKFEVLDEKLGKVIRSSLAFAASI